MSHLGRGGDFIGISMPSQFEPVAPQPASASDGSVRHAYGLSPASPEAQPASSQPYLGAHGYVPASPSSQQQQQQQQQAMHNQMMRRNAAGTYMPNTISTQLPPQGSASPRYNNSPLGPGSPYSPLSHLPLPSAASGPTGHHKQRGSISMHPPHHHQQQQQQYSPSHHYPADMPAAPGSVHSSMARQASQQAHYGPTAMPMSPAASSSPGAGSTGARSQHLSPAAQHRLPQFRRVSDSSELRPLVQGIASSRRADPAGGFISPLKGLTTNLLQTYHQVNPTFRYEPSHNPRRVLTKPSTKGGNDGYDNEDSDYILYVNDWLGSDQGNKYLILDLLGQGTFGQVVKCQNMKTNEVVAVKVIKNKPAYYNQSMMEVTILDLLNNTWDNSDEHHLLRLKDQFIHHRHLCLVFELLSVNLYELIKQNSFRGLSSSLVRVFTAQLLDALTVLNEARLIHCDLKPENILLKTLQSPNIKVIDFGSACHEKQTVYTYIQSRFYRAPEVLLGLPYNSGIDMWSLGCICVELFLGLPLFPGTSEYNQLSRIIEMLGAPPTYMLDVGKQTGQFFDAIYDVYGTKTYRFKSLEQYSAEHNTNEQPSKRYFNANTLPDIINTYPMAKKDAKPADVEREMNTRRSFIDFVQGLLNMDPTQRWTPQQAKMHPFVLGEPLTTDRFVPPSNLRPAHGKVQTPQMAQGQPPQPTQSVQASMPSPPMQAQQFAPPPPPPNSMPTATAGTASSVDSKRPYGGLVTQPQASSKSYQDAAAYNRHLHQQQSYNAMQAANAYRQSQMPTNPYAEPPPASQMKPPPPPQGPYGYVANPPPPAHQAQHYPNRTRVPYNANDSVPLQLQRLAMEMSSGGVGKSMTPVLKRDDQTRAWERRHGGAGNDGLSRKVSLRHHPALDLLTQQAELGYRVSGGRQPMYQAAYSPRHAQHAFPMSAAAPPMENAVPMTNPPLEQPQLAHTLASNTHPQMASAMAAAPAQSGSLYDSGIDSRHLDMYTPMKASNLPPSSPQSAQQAAYAQQQASRQPSTAVDPASMPYASPGQPPAMGFWGRGQGQPQNSPMWP